MKARMWHGGKRGLGVCGALPGGGYLSQGIGLPTESSSTSGHGGGGLGNSWEA